MKRTALLTVFAVFASGCCAYTRPFRAADGTILPDSVATTEYATIGGTRQHLWFRGRDRHAPALILLHAGPGVSEAPMFRRYNAGLEQHFLVVYWEQRGAGRSYAPDIPPQSMTIARFLSDLDEVVELVRHRFGKDTVVLVGHSWGTVLGTIYAYEHPEKVAVYVGVGQFGDVREGARLSWAYALAQAEQRGNRRAARELRAFGPQPRTLEEVLVMREWVERFGGSFYGDVSMGDLIRAVLMSDETNLVDLWRLRQGSRFSMECLWPELSDLDLRGYRSFNVPVFFLLGRHDWQMPARVAADYFATVEAPCKRLVWFEQSAHYPPFEEPQTFEHVLIEQVLPLARTGRRTCPLEDDTR
ncbi:MAG TPA: alpha/beta hydrolase [Candidatus Margulisiibacteriota bacterium]|nr:alpha/beta hydrolase [Candidatus Margulisiibacteriota bacterium]